jgi:hypothetical protein
VSEKLVVASSQETNPLFLGFQMEKSHFLHSFATEISHLHHGFLTVMETSQNFLGL